MPCSFPRWCRRDLFTARELGHLSFVRWLYRTGRVVP